MNSKALAEITIKIGSGATPRGGSNSYLKSGPVALIRSQNIRDEGFDYSGLAYINEGQAERLKSVEVQLNDVLINITGDSVARVGRVPKNVLPARVNQHVAIIRTKPDEVDPTFLYYSLIAPNMKERLLTLASNGATRNALTKLQLEKLIINLPPVEDQRKIISTLSLLDEKIETNRRINETLEQVCQELFNRTFIQEPLAENWEQGQLSNLVAFNPLDSVKRNSVISWVEMAALPTKGMSINSFEKKEYSGGAKFRNGDTLLARITPSLENGKTAYVSFLNDGEVGAGSTEFIVMRGLTNYLCEYVYLLARSEPFRKVAIQSMIGSSGRQRVQVDSIKSYPIQLPPEDVLTEFSQLVSPLFTKIAEAMDETATLTGLRDSLLPNLINGKIKPLI